VGTQAEGSKAAGCFERERGTLHLFQPPRAYQMPEPSLRQILSMECCVYIAGKVAIAISAALLHIELSHPTNAPAAARKNKGNLFSCGFVAREQQEAIGVINI